MRAIARGILLAATTGCLLNGTALGDKPSQPARMPAPEIYPSDATWSTTSLGTRPPPYPRAPADPWAAVVGDQPRRMTADEALRWRVRADPWECSAARDHCFAPNTWLLEWDEERDKANRSSYAYSFVEDGKQASQVAVLGRVFAVSPGNLTNPPRPALLHEEAVTAYRTVPATTRNLVPGALVMVMPFPAKHPASGLRPYQISWITGIVDRVDRELGFVYLVGRTEPAWISSTRVAVLSWRLGGKVTILGGLKRDQLAVSVGEVTLPD